MDSLIGTIIFLLPGFLAYYWLQAFGMNPVTKHSTTEFTTVSILLWLPVTVISLVLFNLMVQLNLLHAYKVWTIDSLKKISGDFSFIVTFLAISVIVSFVFSAVWSIVIHKWIDKLINLVRGLRNMAPLSQTTTVWEEFFIRIDENQDNGFDGSKGEEEELSRSSRTRKKRKPRKKQKIMLLQIAKIDKPTEFEIGSMIKASRPYETDRAIVLVDSEEWRKRLDYYDFGIKRIYFDLKSGLIIKELDHENPAPKKETNDDNTN